MVFFFVRSGFLLSIISLSVCFCHDMLLLCTVWCGREEPRCPQSDAALLCPASRKSGVRRHPRPTWLPRRVRRHVDADRDTAQRQPQRQQQQRTVRAEPQHQHHVDREHRAVSLSVSQRHDTVILPSLPFSLFSTYSKLGLFVVSPFTPAS